MFEIRQSDMHDGVAYHLNTKKKTLRVDGDPSLCRNTILRLRKIGKIPHNLKSIWFPGEVIKIISGVNLIIYLAAKPPKQTVPGRKFTDILQTK